MSVQNEWLGGAPAVAQVVTLLAPESSGPVEFYIGGKPLGWNLPWTEGTGNWQSTKDIVALWNASPLGEFKEVRASAAAAGAGPEITLTAVEAGRPFAVTTTVGGQARSNEIQTVTLARATGGTFTLRFNGETTGTIAWNASASTLQTALEALSNIASGDVTVTKTDSTWTITFAGAYALVNVPVLIPDYTGLTGGTCGVRVTALTQGVVPVNEVQVLTLPGNPTGGTFTLSLSGIVTGNIAWNASASDVQTALRAVLGSSNVSCSGGALPGTAVTITFSGDLGGQNLPLLVPNGTNLTGATLAIGLATTVTGVTGTNAKYRFALNADPSIPDYLGVTGFKFRMVISFGSHVWQTAELDYTASAATIRAALENMVYINTGEQTGDTYAFCGSGNVTVTGTLVGSWNSSGNYVEVEFVNKWHSTRINLTASKTNSYAGANFSTTIVSLGVEGTNEVQTLTQTGTPSGAFRLSWGGVTSDPIAYGASAGTIEDTLVRMANLGQAGEYYTRPLAQVVNFFPNPHGASFTTRATVRASGGPLGTSPVTLTFGSGGKQSTNVAAFTVDEGAASVTSSVDGVPGVSEVQTVQLTGSPWGGTFTLTFDGQTTGTITHNASPSEMAAALEALSNLDPGQVTVSKAGSIWSVAFAATLGNVPTMSGTGTGLKNGTITIGVTTEGGLYVTQKTIRRSRGPWHYDDPFNWSQGRIPQRDDLLRFQFGNTGPRWGITQAATFTVDGSDLLVCSADFANGQIVEVKSSGTLPSGLTAGTSYYVRDFNRDQGVFRLAATLGGTAISLSGGSGTHTVFVPLAGIKTFGTWTGWIGNTVNDREGKFRDYRPTYLKVGFMSGAKVTLSEGPGSSSSLVRIDSGDWPLSKCEVLGSSGSKESELAAVLLLMTNNTNGIEAIDGDIAIGLLRDEVSTLHHLIQRGGTVQLGAGVTFAAGGYIDKTRGTLLAQSTLDGGLLVRG